MTKEKQSHKKKRSRKEELLKELADLGDNIVTGKRSRKQAKHKNADYEKSLEDHKKLCNPKGGFLKGSKANYDYGYDGKHKELSTYNARYDKEKYDSDFVVSDNE